MCLLGFIKVVVGRINGVVLKEIVYIFCRAKKSGPNYMVVLLTRWS